MSHSRVDFKPIVEHLCNYLESPEYFTLQLGFDKTVLVADIVWCWLEYGGGYEQCDTFEVLLLLMIMIAEEYSETGGDDLWQHLLRPTHSEGDGDDYIAPGSVRRFVTNANPTPLELPSHVVLNSEEFTLGLERARRRRQDQLSSWWLRPSAR